MTPRGDVLIAEYRGGVVSRLRAPELARARQRLALAAGLFNARLGERSPLRNHIMEPELLEDIAREPSAEQEKRGAALTAGARWNVTCGGTSQWLPPASEKVLRPHGSQAVRLATVACTSGSPRLPCASASSAVYLPSGHCVQPAGSGLPAASTPASSVACVLEKEPAAHVEQEPRSAEGVRPGAHCRHSCAPPSAVPVTSME